MSDATKTRRRVPGRGRGLKLVISTPTPECAAADPLSKLLAAAESNASGALKVWLTALLKGDAAEVADRKAA